MSKQKRAVMVSLEKSKEGKLKLILDDLVQAKGKPTEWTKDVLITFKECDIKTFEKLEFSDKELADFGYYIIARLHAFYELDES